MRRWRSSFSKKNSSEDSRRSYAGRTKAPGPHDRGKGGIVFDSGFLRLGGGLRRGRKDQGMSDENGPKDVAYYGHPPFVAPEIGEQPPVGAWIAKDAVCGDCMAGAGGLS